MRKANMYTKNDLISIAESLLEMNPDPIPKYRIYTKILDYNDDSTEVVEEKRKIESSKWYKTLSNEQLNDGTWGRFHTRDSRKKIKVPTTEIGIKIALECGQSNKSSIFVKTVRYIEQHLEYKLDWVDPPEIHDNPLAWPIEIRNISAAVLSTIDRDHPKINTYWDHWSYVVKYSFSSGQYSRTREINVRNELDKCTRKNPYPFHVMYPLLILSSTKNRLGKEEEDFVLDYVLNNKNGIYYVTNTTPLARLAITDKEFYSQINAHILLSRFSRWKEKVQDYLCWVWNQRMDNNTWDFGNKVARKPYTCFPLSESWTKTNNRIIDSTLIICELLKKGL